MDKIVRQFAEKAPIAPVMGSLARVVTAGHPREAAKGAGVPHADAFDLVFPDLAVGYRKAGAGRADVSAAAAFQAAVADLFKGLVQDTPWET